jgi:hypothetical protein
MVDLLTPAKDLAVLRLIAEQYAVRIDQLARFIDCDHSAAADLTDRLARLGYVEQRALLAGQAEWIWLTKRGAGESGTRFTGMRPQVGSLERIAALNEVRLLVARRAPEARWISGRSILREQGRHGPQPQAVIEIAGEEHAVAVKLGQTRSPQTEQRFAETLMGRYDALIVFAGKSRQRALRLLASQRNWPKLILRDLPSPAGHS